MPRVTTYVAQPFERRFDGFHPLRPRVTASASEAENLGELLAQHHDGVLVIMQTGDPEWDVWDEAEVLAEHGFVPQAYFLAA